MVERVETVLKIETLYKVVLFTAVVSTNDTIVIEDLETIVGLAILKQMDGTSVAATKSANTITITETGLTDVPVVGIATGSGVG